MGGTGRRFLKPVCLFFLFAFRFGGNIFKLFFCNHENLGMLFDCLVVSVGLVFF